jgi:hypothetical protein
MLDDDVPVNDVGIKIGVFRNGDLIETRKDFRGIRDRAEIAHVICELKLIIMELLELYVGGKERKNNREVHIDD